MEVITEKDIEVVIDNVAEVNTHSVLEVDVIDNTELAVSVNRKEFNIVGDELYIPKRYEDAPQWLRDLISTVTDESYTRKITDLNNLSTSLKQLIVELEVAKNTYTQSIISSNDIDERINTAITTLNSSLSSSDSTMVDLISTRATPEEASIIALNTISSSINDGEIGALVGAVSNTLATETGALANNIDLVHAEMLGGFESTADVIQTTQAYVGIDEAGASTGTGLSAYLEDSAGNIGGADSQVANAVYVNNGVPTSKFEYTSNLSKNGIHYKSGFGLKTLSTGGNGSAANPYDSEFWINAAKLKFTNDNVTGQVAPFTIDATGISPNITFNGKVSFTNVTGTSNLVSTSNIQNAIANNVTTIDGGKIVTNQVFVHNLNATGGVVADSVRANTIIGNDIYGSEINGTIINGSVINGARINGAVIKASYLDLDGDLEVLTDYHITIAMYNANPGLYSDAVFIGTDNEYRIPTTSSVTYNNVYGTSFSNFYTNIWSYTTANVGNNNKARKSRPYVSFPDGTSFEIGNQSSVNTSASCSAYIFFGNIMIIGIVVDTGGEPTGKCSIYNHTGLIAVVETRSSKAISVVSHGITFTGTLFNDGRVYLTGNQTFSMTGDWTSGRIYGTVGGTDGTPYFNIPTLVINNMI